MRVVKNVCIVICSIFLVWVILSNFVLKSTEEITEGDLESRYEEVFDFVGFTSDNNTVNSKSMYFKGKYGTFIVTKYFDNDRNEHFKDSYLGYKYFDDIQGYLKDAFGDGYYVTFDVDKSSYPEYTTSSVSLKQLLKDEDTLIKVHVSCAEDIPDDEVERVVSTLYDKYNMMVDCTIDCDTGEKVYFMTGETGGLDYLNRE